MPHHKCCASTESFANICNAVSIVNAPQTYNANSFVPLSYASSSDWTIDPDDSTKLICQNSGTWTVFAQYQCGSLVATPAQVSGWFVVNGFYQDLSIAVNSLQAQYDTKVLVIGYAYNFNKGDNLQLGIRCSTTESVALQQGIFYLPSTSALNTSGLNIPSMIVTMTKR